jgi:beta-glucosidase
VRGYYESIRGQAIIDLKAIVYSKQWVRAGAHLVTAMVRTCCCSVKQVRGGVHAVMCSYNKVKLSGQGAGLFSCENPDSLRRDLKQRLNFSGLVMSDWYATHSMSINAGLDIEMPGAECNWLLMLILPKDLAILSQPAGCTYNSPAHIHDAVSSGHVTEDAVDDSVTRILTALFEIGEFDVPNTNTPENDMASVEHHGIAAEISAAGTVLVKNIDSKGNALLPIAVPSPIMGDQRRISLAVIGHEALGLTIGGGGSGGVVPANLTSPLNGIRARVGLAQGVAPECTPDGRVCVRFGDVTTSADIPKAMSLASGATHVLVFVATASQEGQDRDNLSLNSGCQTVKMGAFGLPVCANDVLDVDQDELIRTIVAEHGDRTAVVAVTPGALLTPWAARGRTAAGKPRGAAAVLIPFMPGQAYGTAIASLLFGDRNPTGRLPVTFPAFETQQAISETQYPGLIAGNPATPMPRPCTGPMLGPFRTCPRNGVVEYTERLEVGYRWFHANNVTPAWCFGHGISYTNFSYGALQLSRNPIAQFPITVSLRVTNSGNRAGATIPQLYLTFPASAGEPPRQLKGFIKTKHLEAGATDVVSFVLRARDCSTWNVERHAFEVAQGEFTILVGESSCDVAQRTTVSIE